MEKQTLLQIKLSQGNKLSVQDYIEFEISRLPDTLKLHPNLRDKLVDSIEVIIRCASWTNQITAKEHNDYWDRVMGIAYPDTLEEC